ncbi:hypothetical protein [Nocardia blacklockiae]|uniref:hypothetical protein n=1 Tax=Nocardia blacklockiae TaxID=480036 RepID=UPI001895A183|nr:hypothetical protein [Nocardia blacklockiae]MBF6175654.1 hypothetical protein [Nocardia blacklockiae]
MPPEQHSPYWGAIVQNNWPVISPADWHALETKVRDGAAAIDPQEAERARRAFDDRVRASRGLDPIKEDMLAQRGTPQAFVDALVAAADTYGRMSDLVYRTRNKILDIVDEATRAIGGKQAEDTDGDGDNSDEERRRVGGIIANARRAVEERVAASLQEIGPGGLPELSAIADVLGLPGPWAQGPGHHAPPGHWDPRHPHGHGGPHAGPPGGPGPGMGPWPGGFPPGMPGFPTPIGWGPEGPEWPDGLRPELPDFSDPADLPTEDRTDTPDTLPSASPVGGGPGPVSATPAPGYAPAGAAPVGSAPVAGPAQVGTDRIDAPGSAGEDQGVAAPGRAGTHDPTGADDAATIGSRSDNAATQEFSHSGTGSSDAANAGVPFGAPMGVVPAQATTPGSVSQSGTSTARGVSAAGTVGAAPDRARAVSAPEVKAPPPTDSKPGAAAKVIAGSGPPPSTPGGPTTPNTPGKLPPARPLAPDKPGDKPPADTGAAASGAEHETLRDAVGTAMIAAAGPAFVVGERVNGDLVLARSLLSSLLAATGSTAVGVAWSVSVMRHSGGVSAFVTSNEGRGWLPAGVFLPRELSTPWMWSVSEQAPWEGIADPARIMAEFAAAWGVKSGAVLTALVSSAALDAALLRQLGDVAAEGEVEAAATMNFAVPSSGSEDRLGLVSAPQLLERTAGVRPERIRGRCLELAVDAHVRVGKLNAGNPATLGAPALRERILVAMQQGKPVPEEWWEELRDVDDLMAATVLPLRADLSRIALGQLRNEGPGAAGAAAVRALAFERRCSEAVLLLAGEASRQCLRDTVYAHGQIIDHPHFGQPVANAADQASTPRRSAISAGPERRR